MIQDILSILFKPFKKPLNHSRCYETPRIGCQATVFALEIVWVVKWMICFGSIIHAHMCTNWYIHAQISQNYVQIYRYIYIYIFQSSSSIPTKKGIPPGKTWICWKWRWIFRIGKSSKTGGIYRNHLQLAGTTPPWAPRCFPPRWRHISWPGLGHDIMYESMNGIMAKTRMWWIRSCRPKKCSLSYLSFSWGGGRKKLDPDSPDRRQARFRWFHLGSMAKHRALGGFRHCFVAPGCNILWVVACSYVILIFHKKVLIKYQNGMSKPSVWEIGPFWGSSGI